MFDTTKAIIDKLVSQGFVPNQQVERIIQEHVHDLQDEIADLQSRLEFITKAANSVADDLLEDADEAQAERRVYAAGCDRCMANLLYHAIKNARDDGPQRKSDLPVHRSHDTMRHE